MIQVNGLVTHVQELPAVAAGPPAGAAATDLDGGPPADPGGGPPADPAGGPVAEAVAGRPVAVLIHGIGPDSLASWYLSLAHPLADAGFRVIMYDLRGHGRTERPPTGYRMDDLVDDLVGLLDRLGVDVPVHLLGNSLGGSIAFGYAARYPDRVASMVAVESAPATAQWLARVGRQLVRAVHPEGDGGPLATATRGGERGARYAAAVRQLVAATTAGRDLPASTPADPAAVRAITCPVLGIFGSDSSAADLAPALVELLPQTELAIVPGHRHAVLITARDQVRELVLPWLARQLADTGQPALRR
ncbi:alpha/beta fold hydrolase [Solwaraspora sp. WMMD791]|uniref:alpha/beta fold hydrolase n=1 Tax=Solwaraspora sp. WMMD791 TaxID=3016086 RepID=UPI00249A37F3|nr:alpha/beta fold hydrolase [Solwaraspora sp. WMMD791]WFE30456.1 alpha/beta fold hydrolase [Solwaraspora sp. WMMD791]